MIVGDSNMSEYVNLLKVGTTDVVLRMIEANFITRQFALRNSVHAIQRISDDVTCTRTVELEDGRRLSAVEMQLEYLDLAKQYLEKEGSDPTTDLVMKCWEHVLTCLQENPEQLDRELDWVIKRRLIETYASSRNIDWDSPKITMLDYQYHNIRTDVGLYYKLEKDNLVDRIITDAQIEHAMHHPPETTRAKFRGRFVKLANEKKIMCGVNWSYIQLYEPYQKLFLSTNPLQAEYEEASRMIYSI